MDNRLIHYQNLFHRYDAYGNLIEQHADGKISYLRYNDSHQLIRMWFNLGYGYTENADINRARHILAAGHAVLACGDMTALDRSMKQESAKISQTSV